MTTIDLTDRTWGHNIQISSWDHDAGRGRAFAWINSVLKDGDVVIVKSRNGTMPLVVSEVKWYSDPGDMYSFTVERKIE